MNPSFNGGGRIGYNWQPNPYTLIGLENDLGYVQSAKGSTNIKSQCQSAAILGAEIATTKLGDWYDAFYGSNWRRRRSRDVLFEGRRRRSEMHKLA